MFLLDLVYLFALAVLSPWLAWRAVATGRYRRDVAAKLFGRVIISNDSRPTIWFHAVSVGEVNLLGTLVPAFRKRHPDWRFVISSTTESGLAEARRRFVEYAVIAWPFDFSWSVRRTLDRVKPAAVVLVESELWPNFLRMAERVQVPVVLANARMSPRSFRRLQRFATIARRLLLDRVARFAVQDADYAERFQKLGVPQCKLTVTGSIKCDGASGDRDTPRSRELARLLAVAPDKAQRPIIWLAGSTHAPEEGIVLGVFARLRERFPRLRLILVPRHPDRFGEVAKLVEQSGFSFARRSTIAEPLAEMPAVVLLDSVGELGAAWGLADVGFTGGSLDGRRGGQSMIEPAGYGVPCVFGPHVWNFKDAAKRLVECDAAVMANDAAELEAELASLIADEERRKRMGAAARDLVRRQQGATERTLDAIDDVMGKATAHRHAA
ncbi:MAG TPA: 3-deoxy-D-manno-octulosonic acid transferase [Gemmataceae bacterium]